MKIWAIIGIILSSIILIPFLLGFIRGFFGGRGTSEEVVIESVVIDEVSHKEILPTKVGVVKKIVEDYHKTHTYSEYDFFVCADMAIDVWNLVKTKGINAQIQVGNVEEDISELSGFDYFSEINHAWVLAETSPFEWIALETTGGYLVWGEENNLYYKGYSFDNPSEFKRFITLRKEVLDECDEAQRLINYWNENYVGKYLTSEISEFKGRMEAKGEECSEILNELKGLLI